MAGEGAPDRAGVGVAVLESTALAVLDRLTEGCQVVGPDFRYLYVNDAGAAQARRPREALLGRTMMECFPGIERTAMFAELRRSMSDRSRHEMLNEFTYPDGARRWLELRMVPVPAGVCILSRDVTERRRGQDAVADSERLFRGLFDVAPDGILLVGADGRIRLANGAAASIFGYAPGSLEGVPLDELLVTEDRALHGTHLTRFFAAPQSKRVAPGRSLRARRQGGEVFPVEVSLAAVSQGGESLALAIVRDRSPQERLERDLRQAEEQVRQGQKLEALGRLAAGVAHDFNNVLTVIAGYGTLLAQDLSADHPMRADLDEIARASAHGGELTRQLLAFGRNQPLESRDVDLSQLVGDLRRMLQLLLDEGIALELVLAPDPLIVHVDPGQISQVLINLVANARDAMPHGGTVKIVTAGLEVDASHASRHPGATPGPHALLSVVDTGVGMDAATRARAFDPFFTTKEQGRGTGLGLATVYGIVKQSGGCISIDSEAGRGARLDILLPRLTERRDALAGKDSGVSSGVATRGSETVLLAEGDDRVRALVGSVLRDRGYQVLQAGSGSGALRLGERHPATIHLLVSELVLPGMSGLQLAEQLRVVRPDLRVIFLSGRGSDTVGEGRPDGCDEILRKPFPPDELAQRVRAVLDRSRGS